MKILTAEFVTSAVAPEGYPKGELPEVAFMGRSNVGKSSLINSLLGNRKLARTSNTPGRTQLINFFSINGRFLFVDLPGYGYAKVPEHVRRQWGTMVENYLANRSELVLSLLLTDSRHAPTENDLRLKSWLEYHKIPFVVVCTKADRLSNNQLRNSLRTAAATLDMPVDALYPYSSVTGRGGDRIWRVIAERVGTENPKPT
jgi:GTP-binding protein